MANQIDTLFAALSDPTRRAVLEQLVTGAHTVGQLADRHDMALPSFLRHVAVLEEAGLVVTRKQGRARIVALRPRALLELEDWLEAQKTLWEGRLTRLEVLARRLEAQDGPLPETWKIP